MPGSKWPLGPAPPPISAHAKLVLWTGPKHSGKSSALGQLIARSVAEGISVAGILAPSIYQRGRLVGFDVVDVVTYADDYGTQQSQLISPAMFRKQLKPRVRVLFERIKQLAPHTKQFFHSCGNVRPLIPDYIEIGTEILNPVHIRAAGMDPVALKRDFGRDVVFWGGGIDTQGVLPHGTPQDVKDDVRRNIEALAPGGGFVFNTVHNIQADVPPENVIAMLEALAEYGVYES